MSDNSKFALIGAALGAAAILATPAQAQDFNFKDKQIKLTIGYGFGGTYGKYSRMFAEHLKNHIPGNPNIIVDSRPGAGGLLATNYAAKAMPANGLNYLVPPDSSVVVQLMRPKKAKFDMSKFTWIGSANQTNVILVVRSDTGIKKWEDMRKISIPMGSTGLASTSTIMPGLVNNMLGTTMKITDVRFNIGNDLAVCTQNETQNTMSTRVLRSHINEHFIRSDVKLNYARIINL